MEMENLIRKTVFVSTSISITDPLGIATRNLKKKNQNKKLTRWRFSIINIRKIVENCARSILLIFYCRYSKYCKVGRVDKLSLIGNQNIFSLSQATSLL